MCDGVFSCIACIHNSCMVGGKSDGMLRTSPTIRDSTKWFMKRDGRSTPVSRAVRLICSSNEERMF